MQTGSLGLWREKEAFINGYDFAIENWNWPTQGNQQAKKNLSKILFFQKRPVYKAIGYHFFDDQKKPQDYLHKLRATCWPF